MRWLIHGFYFQGFCLKVVSVNLKDRIKWFEIARGSILVLTENKLKNKNAKKTLVFKFLMCFPETWYGVTKTVE